MYEYGEEVWLARSEVGTVVRSPTGRTEGIWVFSPSKGFASDYAYSSVEKLKEEHLC